MAETLSFRIIDITASDYKDNKFEMKLIGIDEKRNTYFITIDDFKPFFYIQIGNHWEDSDKDEFIEYIKELDYTIKKCFEESVCNTSIVSHKTLYDFDCNKSHKFIKVTCSNLSPFYKVKKLYYDSERQTLTSGVEFNDTKTKLYETMIPPMLRYLHIQDISPSGWVEFNKYTEMSSKSTTCNYEYMVSYKDLISLPNKETTVPYKICSFDIEASSSHGDFPEAIKNYKKVAYDMIDFITQNEDIVEENGIQLTMKMILSNVFGFNDNINIDECYLKTEYLLEQFNSDFDKFINFPCTVPSEEEVFDTINKYFNKPSHDEEDDDENENIDEEKKEFPKKQTYVKTTKSNKKISISELVISTVFKPEEKVTMVMNALDKIFPKIKGDYVTFIGSTFVSYGEETSYLNHCICLNETSNLNEETQVIECYDTEKDVLLAWTNLIQKEDPDIIIGYNIFGFDYPFMFNRACENKCKNEFMKLGRNKYNHSVELSETSIVLASGAYDLKYPSMDGRLQIDVFTYMRKEFILPNYKLDFVSSHLISDKIKSYINNEDDNTCKIYTKNIKGITLDSFVHFQIINHSDDDYENGAKFRVIKLCDDGFVINGNLHGLKDKNIKWGLAKDDVTPQDIFRMTNEGPDQKGIIAKYCMQDCNLVHQIFQKIDIMTSYIEMSKICSVPISFLMLRGQGIKLTSYIAKKCREKNTLMPLISKGHPNDAYEGAIVLEPKCNLYLDNPVACVDYSSLYPSSIISENISHDSKVWTKTYNLNHELIKTSGQKKRDGSFTYDNLPGYKYVDIKYDTFGYKRKSPKSKATKVLTGYKICRYAQFPNNEKAIMPSILQELLAARKATKKQMAKETDPFMKNILDKRQLSIKVTANSLYGQTGAKTSTFYEMDVAASTTATGRKLLIYGKDIIENVYKDLRIETKYGPMITNAEYIYGDTDSVFFTFNLKCADTGKKIVGQEALEVTIDYAKEAGELATKFLKGPHDLEYEKTFMPFCLLSKKRYVGMLYEEDPHKCYCKSMGIVLKRRDNAPIVKDVYGGIIDILMKDRDITKSIDFLQSMLDNIVNEKININKLIISKSLRGFYKKPNQIAHKVLSDRIGVRDPGNKPGPGDRIGYVYIVHKNKKALQGEKIETPEFIQQNNIKIDYGFYITNQIMKPVLQIYSLILLDMPQFKRKKQAFINKLNSLEQNMEEEDDYDYEKFLKKKQTLKDKEVEKLLFSDYLRINNNKKNNNTMITSFFKKT